jgi:hypothetical protein
MIASDPLSLFFITCSALGLLYLLANAFLGHGLDHLTDHSGHDIAQHADHTGHSGHAPTAPAPHIPHALHALQDYHAPDAATHQSTSQPTDHNDQQDHTRHFSLLSIFNPMSLALFLVGFGIFGYLLNNIVPVAYPIMFSGSIIGGLLVAIILLMLLNYILADGGTATTLDVADRTGLLGKVIMTIPEAGLGEILYDSPGGTRKSVPARSVDGRRLERGLEIVVINYASGIAEVDTWDHFIQQTESSSAPIPDNIE